MNPLGVIDELYAVFRCALPPRLSEVAAGLAERLGLAPTRAIPWSEVFGHEVTLAAPALFAEAMPRAAASAVRDAVMAHMLGVIEAFGTDRIADGQVAATAELDDLLEHIRTARDEALARVAPGDAEVALGGRAADEVTAGAIREERAILQAGTGVSMQRYEDVSLGKQRVGFPASLALARAAGWDVARIEVLGRTLGGVWMGLQVHDDVVDWQDDLARGGAWAVCLARGVSVTPPVLEPPSAVAGDVLASGVLAAMLHRSRRHFASVRRRAAALGAVRLSVWAAERERKVGELALREAASAGFARRSHALSAWAREVLS